MFLGGEKLSAGDHGDRTSGSDCAAASGLKSVSGTELGSGVLISAMVLFAAFDIQPSEPAFPATLRLAFCLLPGVEAS